MAKTCRPSAVIVVEGYLEYLYQNGILHSFIVNLSIMLILVLIVDGHAKLMKPIEIIASVVEPEKDFADDDAVFLDMGPVQPESTTSESDLDVVVDVPSEPNDEAPAPTVLELHVDRETTTDTVVEDRDLLVELIRPAQAQSARGSIAASGDGGNAVGSGVETLRRLEQAGAQTGDVQVSIAWDNYNDIDLWVVFEGQQGRFVINWMNRIGPNNGMLDVDRNCSRRRIRPSKTFFGNMDSHLRAGTPCTCSITGSGTEPIVHLCFCASSSMAKSWRKSSR